MLILVRKDLKLKIRFIEERRKISGKTTLDSPAIQYIIGHRMYHAVQTKEYSSSRGKQQSLAVNQHLVFPISYLAISQRRR